jgi:ubiquinone/menaquinone biosynthesis C-methylase UbiE
VTQNPALSRQKQWDFADVDQSLNPQSIVHYLERSRDVSDIQVLKKLSYVLMEAQAGKFLLDAGCGIGDDVRALAQIVGPQGRVVGIDKSQTLLNVARKSSEGLDLSGEFVLGDVSCLGIADSSFDGCRAERVLQHCDKPEQVLSEMMRVVRPGGCIVVVDVDYDSMITSLTNHTLARKLTQAKCDVVRNGWIGRQLPGLFRRFGLTDIRVFPTVLYFTEFDPEDSYWDFLFTVGQQLEILTSDDIAEIRNDLQRLSERGEYFDFGVFFSVVGRKPW